MQQFIATGQLANIKPLVTQYRKDFPPWLWNMDSLAGKVYAIPEDIGPMGLVYRPRIFAKYHLATPTTWAIYAKDAVKLHKENPKMYLTFFPINQGGSILPYFWQAGAKLFQYTKAGWKVDFTSPAVKKVANYWGRLIKSGAVPTANIYEPSWGHQLADGVYASDLTAAWGPTYQIAPYAPVGKEHWKARLLPQWTLGARVSADEGGSSNAITAQAVSSKVAKAAVTFATWINTSPQGIKIDELPPGKGGRGLYPGDVTAAKTTEFKAPIPLLDNQRANSTVFAKSATEIQKYQTSPWTTYVYDQVQLQLAKAASGKQSWNHALSVIQANVVHYAEAQGYHVIP